MNPYSRWQDAKFAQMRAGSGLGRPGALPPVDRLGRDQALGSPLLSLLIDGSARRSGDRCRQQRARLQVAG
jgi:hypothetical protein